MKRLSAFALASAIVALAPAALPAQTGIRTSRQPRIVSRPVPAGQTQSARLVPSSVSLTGYSTQLNIVTRVQGLSFYKTAVDITNNTGSDGVDATFQYCFTQSGVYMGCTLPLSIVLHPYDSFHTDDIVAYLGDQDVLPPGADVLSFGSFIVTFANLPSGNGWEGTVTGRTYNPLNQSDPLGGTLAIAYPGSLFFESAEGTLVGLVRDTRTIPPTDAGDLRTNLGVTSTALFSTDLVDFAMSFYDVATGNQVGSVLIPPHALEPGEVYQFNDVFSAANIPSDVVSCIVFVDVTSASGTIEGYINILDGGTNDGAFFEMKCALGCGGGF